MNILTALHHSHEHDGCVDSSPASKTDWMNRLHRGCLSKDTGDKYRFYSHLRALPSRKIPDPNAQDKASTRKKSTSRASIRHSIYSGDGNTDEECETELPEGALSPVFREDPTRPPEASDEVVPELFAVNEFFNYLWSDKWGDEICLRVVGGKLLKLLLTALYDLERRQKLNSHIIRANLNNRRKYVVAEDDALSEYCGKKLSTNQYSSSAILHRRRKSSVKKKKDDPNKLFKNTNNNKSADVPNLPTIIPKAQGKILPGNKGIKFQEEKLRCESMVIQLILYEKADASNVAYTTSDKSNSDLQSSTQIPLPRHVLYPAYSQANHRMNYVRLPISEDVDTKEQITQLTSELDDMITIRTTKCTVDSFRLSLNTGKHKTYGAHSAIKTGTPLERYSEDVGHNVKLYDKSNKVDKQMEIGDSEDVTDNVWFHSSSLIRCEEGGTEVAPSETKINKSNSLLILNEDANMSVKKLNLSCKEKYITGLYAPRNENKVTINLKLQRTKVSKHKVYHDKNLETSNKYKSIGAYEQPECASLLRQDTHSRKLPDLRIKRQIRDDNVSDKLWSQYIKEQEQMEMEVALSNRLAVSRFDKLKNANMSSAAEESTPVEGARPAKKQIAKKVHGQTVTDITYEEEAQSQINNSDAPPQISRRQSPNRPGEDRAFYHAMNSENQQLHTKMLLDKTQLAMNFNSNSILSLPRKRIISKQYLYVHEFQEPCIRTPRPPSEYQKRRSYQIMNQTPYTFIPVDDGNSNFRRTESNYNFFDKYPRRIYQVNCETKDGNWSHAGLNHRDSNDQVDTLSKPGPGRYQCPCAECECIREALADLKPDTTLLAPGYSCRLGKLRRDFDFLQIKNDGAPKEVKDTEIVSHFFTMDVPQICDHLMRLIENVMIRKEILTSSFGQTYITVAFSKEKTSQS